MSIGYQSHKGQPDVSWYNATEQKVPRVASCQQSHQPT